MSAAPSRSLSVVPFPITPDPARHAMAPDAPLLTSQLVVQVCLFLIAAIAMFGGACVTRPMIGF